MSKILVTGGSGFIGQWTASALADEGHEVIIFDTQQPKALLPENVRWIDGDVTDFGYLELMMRGCDEAYDFAGVLGTSELNRYPTRTIDVNIKGAAHFFEAARRNEVARIYHVAKPTFSGNDWENLYSWSKTAAASLAIHYQQLHGMNVAVTKYFNATGPEQHQIPIRKFIPLMSLLAIRNMDLEVYGDGEQTVDLIDVRDVAASTILATRNEKISRTPHIYDNGSGHAVTCNKVAQDIIDIVGSKSRIVHLPMREGEKENTIIKAESHDELHGILGYELQYSYERCLEDTVRSYMAYYSRNIDQGDIDLDFYIKRDGLNVNPSVPELEVA